MTQLQEAALRGSRAEAALQILRLIFFSKNWINRRVDTISFPDSLSITRRVSVDITVPDEIPVWDGQQILPIAMINRAGTINFDCLDEHRDTWSLVTRDKEGEIAEELVSQWSARLDRMISVLEDATGAVSETVGDLPGSPTLRRFRSSSRLRNGGSFRGSTSPTPSKRVCRSPGRCETDVTS